MEGGASITDGTPEESERSITDKKIPASLLERRFQALEDSIAEMKKAIDNQSMAKEVARLTNKIIILQNLMMNEIPPEGTPERRKCMHIMESVVGPLGEQILNRKNREAQKGGTFRKPHR